MVQTSKVNATAGVSKAGLAGILMTLGIVFGDIGTMGHRTKRFFQWSGKMGERL